jgi:hypothetical protein
MVQSDELREAMAQVRLWEKLDAVLAELRAYRALPFEARGQILVTIEKIGNAPQQEGRP